MLEDSRRSTSRSSRIVLPVVCLGLGACTVTLHDVGAAGRCLEATLIGGIRIAYRGSECYVVDVVPIRCRGRVIGVAHGIGAYFASEA